MPITFLQTGLLCDLQGPGENGNTRPFIRQQGFQAGNRGRQSKCRPCWAQAWAPVLAVHPERPWL